MKKLIIISLIIMSSASFLCARPTGLSSLVVADDPQGVSPDNTVATGDVYIEDGLEVDGATKFDGALTLTGAVNITGATDISATFTQDGAFIQEPGSVVILDTSTALGTLDSFVLIIGSGTSGAFAMTSDATPFIATTTATNGQQIKIMGTDATGTVTLSDNSQVAGSLLELDGNTIVIGLGSNITFTYFDGSWYQSGGINTID